MLKPSFNYFVLMLIVAVFGLQYYLSSNYIEKAFQHSTYEIRTNALENEITKFKEYFAYRLTVIIMQCVGIFLCLNIGFLYFNLTIRFKDMVHLVVISLFAIIIHQVLCLVLIKLNNWMFVTSSVNAISEKLSLANYIKSDNSVPWLRLSLSTINLEQIIISIFLIIGIHKTLKVKYKKAIPLALKTHGLGVLLWFVFAMVMEMNFSY